MMQHPDYPFMLANVDGVIYDKEDGMCIFEAKTASAFKAKEWENHVPEEYQLQIQHYMAVTGAKKTYIAALIGGNQFIYHVVEREEEVISLIIQMEEQFWNHHVVGNHPPELDGSTATTKYLGEKYKSSTKTSIQLPKETLPLFQEYDTVSEHIKELNGKKEEIYNQLKGYLKENEEGIIEDRVVKWTAISKEKFNQKLFQEEKKELYDKYLTQSTYRRFTVA